MTTQSLQIEKLLSFSVTDIVISSSEQHQIFNILLSDPNISQTIKDLEKAKPGALLSNFVERLIAKLVGGENGGLVGFKLIQLLGGQLDHTAYHLVKTHVSPFVHSAFPSFNSAEAFELCHGLISKLRSHGVNLTSPTSSPPNAALVGGASEPFSGVGASGDNATNHSIPIVDQGLMFFGHDDTKRSYENPIGGLGAYMATLTPTQRLDQVRSLVRQPISSIFPFAYGVRRPSRASVIRQAAALHNLEPALIAAFILAEQRDQSRREDAAEYQGAVSVLNKNTSIGLGQIVISTAQTHHLFQDLILTAPTRARGHKQTAALLASDEYNIFGVARYIRMVANNAATMPPAALSATQASYPGFDVTKFAGNSSMWTSDNIRAMGSEYTSRAWDGVIFPHWGNFVHTAYQNVKASGAL